jgi:3-hydroxybutyryl-CoA dehydratase
MEYSASDKPMKGKTIKEIHVGDSAEYWNTIYEKTINRYAEITGDFNPAHMDEAFAEKTVFGSRIAHGFLSAGFISTVIGTTLPGPGTIYINQELNFTAPVYIGDTVRACVEVVEIREAENRVVLETLCMNQNEKIVIKGRAVVSPPKEQ